MGLESGTFINSLNASNPSNSDSKSQGDDHLRLLKATIKATFPNVAGAVTPTQTELNYVGGVTSGLQSQLDAKASDSHGHASGEITGLGTAAVEDIGTTTGNIPLWESLLLNGSLSKDAAYEVAATDRGKLIDATTGTWSLTIAAGVLSAGFAFAVRNSGTGVITINPYLGEQIDGASTIDLAAGESCLVVANAGETEWKTVGRTIQKSMQYRSSILASGADTWTAPAGVTSVFVVVAGGGGGGAGYDGSTAGGSGGSGGLAAGFISVTPGVSYSRTVGAGGAGGTYDVNGSAGGPSSFSTLATASGGGAGLAGGANGADGTGTGGTTTNGACVGAVPMFGGLTTTDRGTVTVVPWTPTGAYQPGGNGRGGNATTTTGGGGIGGAVGVFWVGE